MFKKIFGSKKQKAKEMFGTDKESVKYQKKYDKIQQEMQEQEEIRQAFTRSKGQQQEMHKPHDVIMHDGQPRVIPGPPPQPGTQGPKLTEQDEAYIEQLRQEDAANKARETNKKVKKGEEFKVPNAPDHKSDSFFDM